MAVRKKTDAERQLRHQLTDMGKHLGKVKSSVLAVGPKKQNAPCVSCECTLQQQQQQQACSLLDKRHALLHEACQRDCTIARGVFVPYVQLPVLQAKSLMLSLRQLVRKQKEALCIS